MIREAGRQDRPCVLLVDDEQEVLASLADLLRKEFRVIATDDPEEAIGWLQKNETALLLTDQRMPDMTGVKLLAQCSRISPLTPRILVTGYSDIEAVVEAVNEGKVHHYVTKPWQSEQLLSLIRGAVEQNRSDQERLTLVGQLSEIAAPSTSPNAAASPPARHLPQETIIEILQSTVDTFGQAVTVLEGMKAIIPICVYCRKVRTRASEWQDLLEYLAQNSHLLSHGICPECLKPVRADEAREKTRS